MPRMIAPTAVTPVKTRVIQSTVFGASANTMLVEATVTLSNRRPAENTSGCQHATRAGAGEQTDGMSDYQTRHLPANAGCATWGIAPEAPILDTAYWVLHNAQRHWSANVHIGASRACPGLRLM